MNTLTASGINAQYIVALFSVTALVTAWFFLARSRDAGNHRPPIVGVQKHGRIHYVRKDVLDTSHGADAWQRKTGPDLLERAHRKIGQTDDERRRFTNMIGAVILAAIASLVTGVILFGQ